jgi:hypothetical protein
MKNNCRKALAAFVLALAFSSSAFANDGVIWPEIAPPPPPPPATNGVTHTDVETDGIMWPNASDALTDIALTLLGLTIRF